MFSCLLVIVSEAKTADSLTAQNRQTAKSQQTQTTPAQVSHQPKHTTPDSSFKNEVLSAQSRNSDSVPAKKTKSETSTNNKAVADMHSIYQQHLIGPNVANAIVSHDPPKSEKKDIWSRFGSKEANTSVDGQKKGKLQTVGSVIGDIIGVLVSEIARFFGSVVSDVAREVTAHGFVSLFKQLADLTGISFPGSGHVHANTNSGRHSTR